MASYTNSIHALRELLVPSNLSYSSRSITKISQNISCLSNGIEYCLIEIKKEVKEGHRVITPFVYDVSN